MNYVSGNLFKTDCCIEKGVSVDVGMLIVSGYFSSKRMYCERFIKEGQWILSK